MIRAIRILQAIIRGDRSEEAFSVGEAKVALLELRGRNRVAIKQGASEKQLETLAALSSLIDRTYPRAPHLYLLAEEMGLAKSSVHERLDALEERGFITRPTPHAPAGMRITPKGADALKQLEKEEE